MTVYRYDLVELEGTRDGLGQLASDFDNASRAREGAEDSMGYPSLRDAITEFSDNWKNNREKQLEGINGAKDVLTDICANYRAFDQGAVDTLQGQD